MTVKELIKCLQKQCPEDAEVIVSSDDEGNNMNHAGRFSLAEKKDIVEDYGFEFKTDSKYCLIIYPGW